MDEFFMTGVKIFYCIFCGLIGLGCLGGIIAGLLGALLNPHFFDEEKDEE